MEPTLYKTRTLICLFSTLFYWSSGQIFSNLDCFIETDVFLRLILTSLIFVVVCGKSISRSTAGLPPHGLIKVLIKVQLEIQSEVVSVLRWTIK